MFVRGIIDRLDKTRLSRFASHASGFSGSQATVYMHKAYLEQTILILNALSFLVCLGSFAAVPFVEIQLFTRNSTNCKIENDVRCFALNTTVKWSAYSFSTGGYYLLPLLNHMINYTKENISLPIVINDAMKDLQMKWTKYQTIWPLDLMCCLNALLLDFIRRFRRMKRLIYDSAPMFCMSLMLFAIAFIRAVEIFFYYNLLTRASDLLSQVNSFIKFRANELDEFSPHQFTLVPPKIQFTLAIIGLFASVLDITLILDYMDPV
ncbi:hypothetical protein EG68_06630 [Paragonimus skrjabini miyazakii]|uniref:Uncharacterized protein n=1 Tax=Paragonimus skrjabini miyazakii TaxID=59628 RepID=A0A8S9YUD4_9TREM|nr:hypothetical protein EG68_06630 [Paragonimus skrjabini miyazakii]